MSYMRHVNANYGLCEKGFLPLGPMFRLTWPSVERLALAKPGRGKQEVLLYFKRIS